MHKTITIQIAIENAWKDLGLDHKQLPEKETVSEAQQVALQINLSTYFKEDGDGYSSNKHRFCVVSPGVWRQSRQTL